MPWIFLKPGGLSRYDMVMVSKLDLEASNERNRDGLDSEDVEALGKGPSCKGVEKE